MQFIIIMDMISFLVLKYFFELGFFLNPIDEPVKSDIIVVLSGDKGDRVEKAIDLYRQKMANKILFCGEGHLPKETISKKYNIPISSILIEKKSLNTLQNAINCSKILNKNNYKSIILVTSGFHQYRASYLFKKYFKGKIYNISAKGYNWSRLYWWTNHTSRKYAFSELLKIIYIKLSEVIF